MGDIKAACNTNIYRNANLLEYPQSNEKQYTYCFYVHFSNLFSVQSQFKWLFVYFNVKNWKKNGAFNNKDFFVPRQKTISTLMQILY